MHFGCVDFPEELVKARSSGELVVFAGAGVSKPAPSNLPDFRELAILLAEGTATPEDGEPLDQFLGKLAPGLRIHERTCALLSDATSKPNPLHVGLLKLFGGPEAVRIVTTNFDDHFAKSAAEIWPGHEPEIFAAPALPVGREFSGIVHLHGTVKRHPNRIVITDKDFGRAYLTEGWARRFLQDIFLNYIVLFVGYSHNDPVVHHLARGLPASTIGKRFAMTTDDASKDWEHRGIVPLKYPKRPGADPHSETGIALTQWVAFTAEHALDSRDRIRRIVSERPPDSGEDHDYLVEALNAAPTARFFTEFAKTDEWLAWAQGRDAFVRLFQGDGNLRDPDWVLAQWFAEAFAMDQSDRVLEWIARNKLTLGAVCWQEVGRAIYRRMHSAAECPRLDRWVALLIQTRPRHGNDQLGYILAACHYPRDLTAVLLLFQHLLRPVPTMEPDLLGTAIDPSTTPNVDLQITTFGDSYELGEVWQKHIQPNLHRLASPLASIAAAHLEETALLSSAYGEDRDFVSSRFHDIGNTDRHAGADALGLLVEVAREALCWLIQNDRTRGDGLIEAWLNGLSPVLQRIAVLGVARSPSWSANDKVKWLLDQGVLDRLGFAVEVSNVLSTGFRSASIETKNRLIDRAIAESEDRDPWMTRMRLLALKNADPDCARIDKELAKFPEPPEPEQTPRIAVPSSDELLAIEPAEGIEGWAAFESKYTEKYSQEQFLATILESAVGNPDWGLGLAVALRERAEWRADLWNCVVRGWNQDGLSFDQWSRFLGLLVDSPPVISGAADEIVNLLNARTSRDSTPFTGELFPLAVRIGFIAWDVINSRTDLPRPTADDWLTVAINKPGGQLAEFCVRMLWRARKAAGEERRGLPGDFRVYFESVIRGTSWAAEMARVVTAASLHTLFVVDPRWARDNVFGLLDWSVDLRRAQQAWQGYLVWGRWDNNLLADIFPFCRQTFPRIERDLGARAEQFCERMASIALYGVVDPMESGWLPEFVRNADLKARRRWAFAVGSILHDFPAGRRGEVWRRWMHRYWEFRLEAGSPLDPEEIEPMVQWSAELEEAFPEAVALVIRGPAVPLGDMTFSCLRLQQSTACSLYPRESAELLGFLVRSENRLQIGDYIVDLVRKLAPLGAQKEVLKDICHRLAALGDRRADSLLQLVESQVEPPAS